MRYNWKPVLNSFMRIAMKHGLKPFMVNNGDGWVVTTTIARAVEEMSATDESHIKFHQPDGSRVTFYIVLGNEAYETIADYGNSLIADKVADEFIAAWENRKVPVIKPDDQELRRMAFNRRAQLSQIIHNQNLYRGHNRFVNATDEGGKVFVENLYTGEKVEFINDGQWRTGRGDTVNV